MFRRSGYRFADKNMRHSITARARYAPSPSLAFPQRREPYGDDVLISRVPGENADLARELRHGGNEAARDRSIVIGQIASDQIDDEGRFAGGKEPAADLESEPHIVPQRLLGVHDRAHRRSRGLRRALNQSVRRRDRRHGVIEAADGSVAATDIENDGADA